MTDEPSHDRPRYRSALLDELSRLVEDFERTKASAVAKTLFEIGERLVILTAFAFAERRAPPIARAGLALFKLALSVAFVFWVVTPVARWINRLMRRLDERAAARPAVKRTLAAVYVVAVVLIALGVSHALNYFLSYLVPEGGG